MERNPPEPFVRLPATTLSVLADACSAAGPAGVDALREAGCRAGARIFDSLDVLPETMPAGRFFEAADRALQACGLGSIDFEAVDGGLIAMAWRRLPEAGAEVGLRTGRGCPLATGILGGLLSRAAGRPVAVLEVDCAADGGDACWFLVGSEARLRRMHGRIGKGDPPRAWMAAESAGPGGEATPWQDANEPENAHGGRKDAESGEVPAGDPVETVGDPVETIGDPVEASGDLGRGGVER